MNCTRLLLSSLVFTLCFFGGVSFKSAHPPPKMRDLRPQDHSGMVGKLRDLVGNIRGGDTTPPAASTEQTETTKSLRALQGMTFSGQLITNARNLFAASAESYGRGWRAVQEFHHNGDLLILVMVSMLPVPFMKVIHQLYYKIATNYFKKEYKEFEKSRLHMTGVFLEQGGRIAALIYLMELLTTFVLNVLANAARKTAPKAPQAVPKNLISLQKLPSLFSNIAYGLWLAKYATKLKTRMMKKIFDRLPDPETYDRLLNFLIYIIASILILDASQFDLEALVKSLVAVGGLSSIVVGLALKDPATQLLQGALMMASNKYHRNESIRLGDGTQGKVVDIGLLETTIMGGDDILMKIPHSKLAGQKFSNISRMRLSQTKFELRFHLYDMRRVTDIAAAIRQQIANDCENLIKDGSRPFRVLWTDIGSDHIVVTVDAHHRVPPACNAYWETREKVLFAISAATKKLNVKLAMPVTVHANLDGSGNFSG